ncbi:MULTISPECIES: pilus assembly protein TadG-related protein [unclassified Streptomyces]|uniref:pilus assembly protein TadG-related protein n=1 Tax=unclassified Streptomyces TaxID=2593676 RepID=UPI000B885AE9|nr:MULTISPECIES: pilus assembly protein TadG-related protein [unclassified Streptomyces]MYQ51862.1 hypothetical protein [Streptomyces sp. SID4941]
MVARPSQEAGQAFPIYVAVVAGLLFLAFAYFAVGQASMKKSEAQTAADAAALAAAQEARDEWRWPRAFDLDEWDELLSGRDVGAGSCSAAASLASQNDAEAVSCAPDSVGWPEASYTVTVVTNKSVGSSVIPGTETRKAEATARAVIEPRCRVEEDRRPRPTPSPNEEGDTDETDEQKAYKVACDDEDFVIDPKNLGLLPDLADLFSVHLADK